MQAPLFGTGLARSGGGLYSMALSAHPQMMVACCPNLEFFRSFRNAVFRASDDPDIQGVCESDAPLQDWYGTRQRSAGLAYLLDQADLGLAFPATEWPEFVSRSVARGELESADIARRYGELSGSTYKEVLESHFDLIRDQRECRDVAWLGFHEAWVIDFFPALARAFPEARLLVMLRDPRAIVNSMLAVERIDPLQVAQILSYVRHWRKYVALARRFLEDPLMAGRLHVTAHDLLLADPARAFGAICAALDVPFDERMLNTDNYVDYTTGDTWRGNSSFETKTSGIDVRRATRWRETLDTGALRLIEFLCGPELAGVGYETVTEFGSVDAVADGDVLDELMRDYRRPANWRSDQGDVIADLGVEVARRRLLAQPTESNEPDLIRRTFLFEAAYREVGQPGEQVLLPDLAALHVG